MKFKIGDVVEGVSVSGVRVRGKITEIDDDDLYIPYAVDGGRWCRELDIHLLDSKKTHKQRYSKLADSIRKIVMNSSKKKKKKKAFHVYVLSKCSENKLSFDTEEERILGVFLTREQGQEHKEKYERTFPNNEFSLLKFSLQATPKSLKKLLGALE